MRQTAHIGAMTISIAASASPMPASSLEVPAEVLRAWDEERDGGVRALRGLLVAGSFAVAIWGGLGLGVYALIQTFA